MSSKKQQPQRSTPPGLPIPVEIRPKDRSHKAAEPTTSTKEIPPQPLCIFQHLTAIGNCYLWLARFLEEARPEEIQLMGEICYQYENRCAGLDAGNQLRRIIAGFAEVDDPFDDSINDRIDAARKAH